MKTDRKEKVGVISQEYVIFLGHYVLISISSNGTQSRPTQCPWPTLTRAVPISN